MILCLKSNLVSKAIFCDMRIVLEKNAHLRKAWSGELLRRFDVSPARVAAQAPEETTYCGNLSAEQQFLKRTLRRTSATCSRFIHECVREWITKTFMNRS